MRKEKPLAKSGIVGESLAFQLLNKENIKKCQSIITKLREDKKSFEFRLPVDYKALGLDDYPLIIKRPMDISTVEKKLEDEKYSNPKEFLNDLQLIWDNCKKYNRDNSQIYANAIYMEKKTSKLINDIFKFVGSSMETEPNLSIVNKSTHPKPNLTHIPIEENKDSLVNRSNMNQKFPMTNNIIAESQFNQQISNSVTKENEEYGPLGIKDKIYLAETFKGLNPDLITSAVNLIQEIKPIAIEEKEEEKLHIRVDLFDRATYEKVIKLINDKQPNLFTSANFKLN